MSKKEIMLTNRLVFVEVMGKEEIAKMLAEEVLEREMKKIERVWYPRSLSQAVCGSSVHFKIWFGDEPGPDAVLYLSCATSKEEKDQVAIARRMALKAAVDEGALESYFITLCDFDPFGAGCALYYEHMKDDVTDEPLEDGPHGFFLNADYQQWDTASKPIIELLDFARMGRRSPSPESELAKAVRQAFRGLKEDSEVVTFANSLGKIGTHPWKIGRADKIIERFRSGELGLGETAAKMGLSEDELQNLMRKLDGPEGACVVEGPILLGNG